MVQIEFTTELQVVRPSGDGDEAFRAEVDRVMNELLLLESAGVPITDAALSLDMQADTVTVEVLAFGDDFDAAARTALSSVRSAIHAAGGKTAGWEWTEIDRRTRAELTPA